MPSLTDLLNPTFFMFLGIILLFLAILVVYFETKARDQNHKITSMLSLVSSLAEELNSVKIGFNNLTMMRGGTMPPTSYMNHFQNSEQNNFSDLKDFNEIDKLIAVSDDDDDDDDDDDMDSDDDDEDDDDDDDEDEDDLEKDVRKTSNEENEVKVLKINLNDIQESAMTFEEMDNLNDLDELEDLEQLDSDSDSDSDFQSQTKETKPVISNEEIPVPSLDLKKINISDLEESKNSETVDYKKLSIQKLKAIVLEKGLSTDPSKLNKPKLLQLLGVV